MWQCIFKECMFVCEQGGPSVEDLQRLWLMLLGLAEEPAHEGRDWQHLDQWALLPTTDGAQGPQRGIGVSYLAVHRTS